MLGSFPLNQLEQTSEICLILSPYVVRLVPLCFFSQRLLSAMPIDTPLPRGRGPRPSRRPTRHPPAWLPIRLAALPASLSLQDAFRCIHKRGHTATNNAFSARTDTWLVSDSLLPSVSATSVTDRILSNDYEVAGAVSLVNAPPRGPGLWSMPSTIISHPTFKTHITAQI